MLRSHENCFAAFEAISNLAIVRSEIESNPVLRYLSIPTLDWTPF
jgi:hypothetical protein